MKAHSVGREAVLGRRSGACARGRPLPDQVLESGRFWVKADLSSGSTAKDLQRLTLNGHHRRGFRTDKDFMRYPLIISAFL
jgi:hypothetical protein